MADLNSFSFTGRCSKNAEIKSVNGKVLMEVDVANNVGYGNYAKTNWLKVKMWGDRCNNIVSIFEKGALVAGQGELTINEWTGNNGVQHTDLVVTVNNLLLLKGKCQCQNNSADENIEDVEGGQQLPF